MRRKTKSNDGNLPGQISFNLTASVSAAEEVPKERGKAAIQEPSQKRRKRNQVPPIKKEIPEDTYMAAKDLLGENYHINSGILVNRLRISANLALTIMDKLKDDGLITEDGKKITENKKKWRV